MTSISRVAMALAGVWILVRIATIPGFYSADELDLLRDHDLAVWWRWEWLGSGRQLFYRPLGFAAFLAQLGIAGGDPVLVHRLSVGHHLLNVALLAWLLRRLGQPAAAAWVLCLLAVAVPGVAWVAAVYDRLACTLLLLAVLSLTGPRWVCVLAVPCGLVALLVKETAIVLLVPAALSWWRRRRDPAGRWVAGSVLVLAVGISAFVAWRLLVSPGDPHYAARLDMGVVGRLLRYAVFPFAVGVGDPHGIHGWHWLGGIGTVVALGLALRGSWRSALAGASLVLAPLLPVAIHGRLEGHCLYLAAPGAALLAGAAWRRDCRASRAALAWVGVVAVVQSWCVTAYYDRCGRVFAAMQRAHAAVPSGVLTIVETSETVASCFVRFAVHVQNGGGPPPALVVEPTTPGAFVIADDGSLARNPGG